LAKQCKFFCHISRQGAGVVNAEVYRARKGMGAVFAGPEDISRPAIDKVIAFVDKRLRQFCAFHFCVGNVACMQDVHHHWQLTVLPLFGAEKGFKMDALVFIIKPAWFINMQSHRLGASRRRGEVMDATDPLVFAKPALFDKIRGHAGEERSRNLYVVCCSRSHGKKVYQSRGVCIQEGKI
jgi:hypothetical protein